MEEINSIRSLFELGALVVSFIFLLWTVKYIITDLRVKIESIDRKLEVMTYEQSKQKNER